MSVEWACNNAKCTYRTNKKKPLTKTLGNHEPAPTCACGTLMDRVTPLPTFDSLARQVGEALAKEYPASYQKKVIDFLKTTDYVPFQPDFTDEMQKPTEFGKFTKNDPARATGEFQVCFDNAIKEAGFDLPKGCPKGEKFDFEIPYIMSTIGWTHMPFCHGQATIFTKSFREFLRDCQPGFSYMLATRSTPTAPIGHMIFVYVEDDKEAWIHDPQKLRQSYKDHFCEAWESPYVAGSSTRPGATINRKTGDLGKFED